MDSLSSILNTFRLTVRIIHNAQYCGEWTVDTSGTRNISFHIITRGQCFLTAGSVDTPQHLETGDLVMFPHDETHQLHPGANCLATANQQSSVGYDVESEGSVGLLCGHFQFTHSASNPLLNILPNIIIKRRSELSPSCPIGKLLDLIQFEALQQPPGNQASINRLTESLFIYLVREHISDNQSTKGLAAALNHKQISQVLDAIHMHPDNAWTLDTLAAKAAMSRSSLASQFKRLLGETVMEYLTRWRMQRAWVLLQEHNATLLDVAQQSGYDNEASFSKAFNRELGIRPGAVRKNAIPK